MFFEQTQIFQEGLSKRHVFSRRFYLFVEQTLLSHRTDTHFPGSPYLVLSNTYEISRSLYFLIEQILIFQEALSSPRTPTIFQETLSSPRTHTIFQETPMPLEHIGIFQEGTPSRTDISLIGLGGCFRYLLQTDFASKNNLPFCSVPTGLKPDLYSLELRLVIILKELRFEFKPFGQRDFLAALWILLFCV